MSITFGIRNYRNFGTHNPMKFAIQEGRTFILGQNNVGKSNILRFFFEFRNIVKHSNKWKILDLNGDIDFGNIINQDSEESEIHIEISSSEIEYLIKVVPNGDKNASTYKINIVPVTHNAVNDEAIFDEVQGLFSKSIYVSSNRFAYPQFSDNGIPLRVDDLKLGTSFISSWKSWYGSSDLEKSNKCEELEKDLRVFFDFKELKIVISESSKDVFFRTEKGRFRLKDLGNGTAQVFYTMANVMMHEPEYIFIDEPELGLHPSKQIEFVRLLSKKAKGLIATSHSIGLARSVADTIYSMTFNRELNNPQLRFFGEQSNYKPNISDLLSELGYSQFCEIGGNNLLLVEGPTDILCFREILRKYGIDQSYIILSLGGKDMLNGKRKDELNDLKRFNANSISVIFDSNADKASYELEPKLIEFKDVCEELGFKVFPTDYHSTENYITQDALDKEYGNGDKLQLKPFEQFKGRQNNWTKDRNWRLFQRMKKEDFNGTKLDKFIKEVLVKFAK